MLMGSAGSGRPASLEEAYPSGADLIEREGVLGGKVSAVVAAHVHPGLPWSAVSVEPGAVNASSDILRVEIEGDGGHGAYPHRVRDHILTLPCACCVAVGGEPSARPNASRRPERRLDSRGLGGESSPGQGRGRGDVTPRLKTGSLFERPPGR